MITNNRRHAGWGVRHTQALLLFLCLLMAYALRVNMSVGIVAMVDRNSTTGFDSYDWAPKTQAIVLSSFFWGYVVTQIPAGQMAQAFGPKILLLFSIGTCSALAVFTPLLAKTVGVWGVVGLRTIQGLSQGFIFPSTHTLLARWAPVSERGRIGTYCYAGSQFGTVLMLSTSGFLASSPMGWPSIFYISGACGILWSILWFFVGANSPSEYKKISPEEREFIETSLGTTGGHTKIKTPWGAMLSSPAMIALILVHSAHNWGFWTLLTEMPTFMKNVLELDIKKNALLSALPYLCMWIASMVLSPISDYLINRGTLKTVTSRKLFNSIGLWGPMLALIGLAYVPKGAVTLAVALLTTAIGINAATYLGFQVNHIDLSPNHAGTMMGITNCAANICSLVAPLVVGLVLDDPTNPDQWKVVFFIAAGVYFFGNLQFVILGRAEKQWWNAPQGEKDPKDIVRRPSIAEAQY